MKKPPFLRTPYNYDMNDASDESALHCKDPTLTQQHMAADCDINVMVERYVIPENIPRVNVPPLQGDFTEVYNFQTALDKVIAAQRSFMEIPAKVRARFNNDPGEFLDFVSDEANRDEMRKMGLWSPEAVAKWEADAKAAADRQAAEQAELAALRAKADPKKGVS